MIFISNDLFKRNCSKLLLVMHMFSLSPTFAIDDIKDNLDNQNIVESPVLSDDEVKTLNESNDIPTEPIVKDNSKAYSDDEEISNTDIIGNENNIVVNEKAEDNTILDEETTNKPVAVNENSTNLAKKEVILEDDAILSDDSTLSNIGFLTGQATLTEKFDPNKKDYVCIVSGARTTFSFSNVYDNQRICVKDPSATMNIYFNDELVFENVTKTNNSPLTLIKGKSNIMRIVVTAESGNHSVYNIMFEREDKNNSLLSNIGFLTDYATLTEKFDPDKKDYTAKVKGNGTTISFSNVDNNQRICVQDPYATMNVYLNNELIFEDVTKTYKKTFNLIEGIPNVMEVIVTSESGNQSTYIIRLEREGYTDTTLSNIGFLTNQVSLTETFEPNKRDYVAKVKGNGITISFSNAYDNQRICVKDPNATMNIYFNDELVFENITKTNNSPLTLIKGKTNIMRIVVTSESGDKGTYSIVFEREGVNNSTLGYIGFYPGYAELIEKLEPEKKEYSVKVKGTYNAIRFLNLTNYGIKTTDPYATMDIYLNDTLIFNNIVSTPESTFPLMKGIKNVMNIVVTAESGDKSTYTIWLERELDSNTNIKEFSINKDSLELKDDTYTVTMNSWRDISISKLILEDSWANYRIVLNDKKEIALNEKFDLDIGDNKLDIEVTSNNGNKKNYPVIFERSDNVNPSVNCNVDNKDWTNEDILISIESSDDSGIRYIELPSGEKVYSNKGEFYPNQNGTYKFKVYDNFLNETIETVNVSNIDKETPTLELKPSTTDLTNESVDIIINASDNIGIKQIETPDGQIIVKSTLNYTVYEDGTYVFKATDLAGNEIEKSIILNNIDSVSPILATELSNEGWSNEEITLSVFAMSDKGIKYIELPDGSKVEGNFAEYGIKENGTYFIATESLGGNITSEKVIVSNIDTELPILSLSTSTNDWTNEDIDIIVNAEDNIGVDYIILPDGQTVFDSKYTYSVESNGTYEFTVFDLAGNKITQNIEIKNIDKNPPVIENYDNLISILSNIITLDLSAVKTPSGIHKVILPNKEEVVEPEDNIIKYEVKYNDTYTFTVVDKAGNSVDVDIKVDSLIDREDYTNNNIPNDKGHMPDTSGINEIVVIISLISAMAGLMILKNRRR